MEFLFLVFRGSVPISVTVVGVYIPTKAAARLLLSLPLHDLDFHYCFSFCLVWREKESQRCFNLRFSNV